MLCRIVRQQSININLEFYAPRANHPSVNENEDAFRIGRPAIPKLRPNKKLDTHHTFVLAQQVRIKYIHQQIQQLDEPLLCATRLHPRSVL